MILHLNKKAVSYLHTLCQEIPERCVGSEGNILATDFFENEMKALGWKTMASEFEAMDWKENGVILHAGGKKFKAFPSPYSLGCSLKAELFSASTLQELEVLNAKDGILLLYGDLAKEQLMPKNFVFYNPKSHQKIISLLENCGAKALICATGRNASLAGGVYPFPLIEDGDFNVPSVYMTEEEGNKLLPFKGRIISLESNSRRISSRGFNIKASKGPEDLKRIVITAHIDAKKGSPGAIDNGTGVVILLLLAELLADYSGKNQIELVAFNGEDYYAVPGQMKYIEENQEKFSTMELNINIDGAGYKEGPSAFSFFDLPSPLMQRAQNIIEEYPGITEGIPWVQGDHSIFVQFGRPAIAVSSKWFIDNIDSQEITHTEKDNIDIVDPGKLVEIAMAINSFIRN